LFGADLSSADLFHALEDEEMEELLAGTDGVNGTLLLLMFVVCH
jgi:hypothetical protein